MTFAAPLVNFSVVWRSPSLCGEGIAERRVRIIASGAFDGAATALEYRPIVRTRVFSSRYGGSNPSIPATCVSAITGIPTQLAKENKRFMLSSVQTAVRYERLKDDFDWPIEAGVALACRLVKESKCPLMRTLVPEQLKLYSSDTGVLLAQNPLGAARGYSRLQ